jgi:hypothetical protein
MSMHFEQHCLLGKLDWAMGKGPHFGDGRSVFLDGSHLSLMDKPEKASKETA